MFVVETKKNCKQKHCFGGKKKKVTIFLSWEVLKFSNLPLLDSSVISGVQCKRYKKDIFTQLQASLKRTCLEGSLQ